MIVPNLGSLLLPGGGLLQSVRLVGPSESDQAIGSPIDPGGIVNSASYASGVWTVSITGDGLVRAGLNDAARWMFDPAGLGYSEAEASSQRLALVWEWLTGPSSGTERQYVGLSWCDGGGNPAIVANGSCMWDGAPLLTMRAFTEAATVTPTIISTAQPAKLLALQTWNRAGSATMGQLVGTGKDQADVLTTTNSLKDTSATAPTGLERFALSFGNQLASSAGPSVFTGRLLAGIVDRWAGL